MSTPVGSPDWSGTATLSRAVTSITENAIPVAAQGVVSWSGNILRQGYEIDLLLVNATHGNVQTPVLVEMIWQEMQTSQVTGYQRHWVFAGDSTGGHNIVGHGPSNGNFLTVTVNNFNAGTPTVDVTILVQDVARNYTTHEWVTRDDLSPVFPDYALAPSDVLSGILCAFNQQTVAAAGGVGFLLPYCPGNYVLSFVNDGATPLFPFIDVAANQGVLNQPIVWHEAVPSTAPFVVQNLTLPRGQCSLSVTNGSLTTAGKFDATLTRQDY